MSIKFDITKQNNIHFGIAAAAAALTGYFTAASWWVMVRRHMVYSSEIYEVSHKKCIRIVCFISLLFIVTEGNGTLGQFIYFFGTHHMPAVMQVCVCEVVSIYI